MQDRQDGTAATVQGIGAIVLWGALGTLTALTGPIPPFQLMAMSFALASAIGAIYLIREPGGFGALARVPPANWVLGLAGLFGFHAAYFMAIKSAPAVEVTIITYLWPLLIVLFSALLPRSAGGGPLRWWHVAGALLGFAGATLIAFAAPGQDQPPAGTAFGYAMAFLAALIWAAYSVASRLFASVPTSTLAVTCAMTAATAAVVHAAVETTVWPANYVEWMVVLAQGMGPVGLAFFLWDAGMKRGNLRLLGVLSYATPLLSTSLLLAAGLGRGTPLIWVAAALVIAGALLAAADKLWPATSTGVSS